MNLLRFVKRNSKLLFFTWLTLIFIASSIPQLPTPKIKVSGSTIRFDYFIHFLEFFILSILFMFWMITNKPKQKLYTWILFLAIGIAFAFFIELYQQIIPGRAFNFIDIFYNCLGYVAGSYIMIRIIKSKKLPYIDA